MAGKSISHGQGKGSLSHNNRKFHAKNVDSSRTKDNVTFVKIPIKQAYEDIFGAAVERYNAKQKRSNRKIKDGYFQYAFGRKPCDTVIEATDKRKSFYEDVVQIGDMKDTGVGSADAEIAKQCLTEYATGFQERNPNFRVFNNVLHIDEATPHLHIDYIPVAHCKRGLDTQNGMAIALKEMGFGEGKDAISRWRERERKVLEDICKRHGIEVAPPQKARGTFTVEEYKRYKDNIAVLEKEKQAALEREKASLERAETAEKSAQAAEKQLEELNGKILTAAELKAIEGKKSIGGALKNVSWEEWQSVKATADSAKAKSAEIARLKKENQQLQSENKKLCDNNAALHYELTSSLSPHNVQRLKEKNDHQNQIRLLKKVLGIGGEVGNYNELRQELIQHGYIQSTSQNRRR